MGEWSAATFPDDLLLTPVRRWPTTLPDDTVRAVLTRPVPVGTHAGPHGNDPAATIVVVTSGNLVYARIALESVLANTAGAYELVVVDNGSRDDTAGYLRQLAMTQDRVRVLTNEENRGFAPAVNQALATARGGLLVLLNDDTIVAPGWLERLSDHARDPALGLLGAMSNRAGNEAELEAGYQTYGGLLRFAADRADRCRGQELEVSVATMFCMAMRRDVFERLGPVDERFEVGLFEDDDYSMRARAAGYRVACAEDVFVHHFGQASIGKLSATGEYGPVFAANRRRWEEKWGVPWRASRLPRSDGYLALLARLREIADVVIPAGARMLVVSKGDDALLTFGGRRAEHFPQGAGGGYLGHHPIDSASAIAALEGVSAEGPGYLLVPRTSAWWLDYYAHFTRYLDARHRRVWESPECVIFQIAPRAVAGRL